MSERKQYEYRILVEDSEARRGWVERGVWGGRTPDEAIKAAQEHITEGAVVAVPLRNWHERQATKRMEPIFELSTPGGE